MGSSEDLEAEYRAFERGLDRELWVVTAADGTQRGGLVATFVSPGVDRGGVAEGPGRDLRGGTGPGS